MTIHLYPNAPTQVRHAAQRLSSHTGLPIGHPTDNARGIYVHIHSEPSTRIGRQGYEIKTQPNGSLAIHANHEEGAANGLYTLLRTLMIEHRTDPYARSWDILETPRFQVRGMVVAPYRFGGSYGFAVLSPDRWSLAEWIEYLDLMRLCNLTTLTLIPAGRLVHPDYPQTMREMWRYEVWRDVMAYCHQIGMKFNWLACPNQVPQEAFWNNPDLRVEHQEAGGYYGCGLVWDKAKDLILEANRFTFEYFRGLDGLEMIYSELGLSFDEATSSDPAGYFADATHAYRKLMRDAGCAADYNFWNWVFDLWSRVVIPEALLKEYPKFRTIIDDLLPQLPKDIGWIDASMLSVIQMFGPEIRKRGNPALRDGVLLGKKWEFDPIINCFWYMNPEYALNMLPHPYINRAIQEAHYSRDELEPDGVIGYRLAPPCRFLGDYAFFRLASDPDLTQEVLVHEMAALLSSDPDEQPLIAEGITLLEEFWLSHDPSLLQRADELLTNASHKGTSKTLLNVSGGVAFLNGIVKLAQPGVNGDKRKIMRWELYQQLKLLDVFQGITSDIVWQPESFAFFCWQADLMVRQYQWYRASRPDMVDRSIYPEASAEFATLNWPKDMPIGKEGFDFNIGEMPGPLSHD